MQNDKLLIQQKKEKTKSMDEKMACMKHFAED